MTKYYHFVIQVVMPNISFEELKLISTHSLRVNACVLLAEAGKGGWYMKLRLRCLCNCFETCLRNTQMIMSQHNDDEMVKGLVITKASLPSLSA